MDVPERLRVEGKSDWESLLIWGLVALLVLALVVATIQSLRDGGGVDGF